MGAYAGTEMQPNKASALRGLISLLREGVLAPISAGSIRKIYVYVLGDCKIEIN